MDRDQEIVLRLRAANLAGQYAARGMDAGGIVERLTPYLTRAVQVATGGRVGLEASADAGRAMAEDAAKRAVLPR